MVLHVIDRGVFSRIDVVAVVEHYGSLVLAAVDAAPRLTLPDRVVLLGAQVQKILTAITVEQAKTLLPPRYTGFVAATHASYESIEKAGIAVGKIKPKS